MVLRDNTDLSAIMKRVYPPIDEDALRRHIEWRKSHPPKPVSRRRRLAWWLKGKWARFWGLVHCWLPGECDCYCREEW